MNKACSMIGFARRAGKLVVGYDAVRRGLEDGSLQRAYLASDLSKKTAENIRYFCDMNGLEAVDAPFTMDEVAWMINKRVGVLGITDRHMDKQLLALSRRLHPTETEE